MVTPPNPNSFTRDDASDFPEVRKVGDRDRQNGDSMMAKFSLWVTNQVLAAQQGQKSRGKISSTSHWNPFRQRTTYDHHLFINKVLLDYCHTHIHLHISMAAFTL